MTTKLNATAAKRVKALNINAKTEEEAREKLLEILVENGIEGMEDEELDTLLDIAESFVENDNSGDDEEQTEEEENDELAQEVEEEEEEEAEEEEEDEDEGDEFAEMDRTALKAYIKDNELDITVKKSMTDDDIRDLIRAEVGEEEEEDEKPEPKAKASTKAPEKPASKKDDEKAPAKSDKKADKKEAKPAAGKRGAKLDPKNNEDDREVFDVLKELFPEDEYVYAWVASAGVTIKHKGKNSQRSMVLIENCSKQADGSIKCNLYLLTFTKQTEVLDEAGIDYEKCWSGAPLIKGITLDEAVEIITGLMEQITATVKKIDKKLGDNRKKMEENLDKKSPKAKKATAKVEDDEEEEEEE